MSCRAWRERRGLAADPLQELAASGYVERAGRERRERNRQSTATYA